MTHEKHCRECINRLGRPWSRVHNWLNAQSGYYFPFKHYRQIHHHTEGVEEVRKMWGDEAAKAAELHIRSDFETINDQIPTREQIEKEYGPLPSAEKIELMRNRMGY